MPQLPSFSSFMDNLSPPPLTLPQPPRPDAPTVVLDAPALVLDPVVGAPTDDTNPTHKRGTICATDDGPPTVYRHLTCGSETELPPRVLEISQIDPCYYNGFTYCSTCNRNWHQSDFKWVATSENVHAYYKRMFREKPASYKVLYYLTWPPAAIAWCALAGWLGGLVCDGPALVLAGVGAGVGFVLGLGPAKSLRYAILRAISRS